MDPWRISRQGLDGTTTLENPERPNTARINLQPPDSEHISYKQRFLSEHEIEIIAAALFPVPRSRPAERSKLSLFNTAVLNSPR